MGVLLWFINQQTSLRGPILYPCQDSGQAAPNLRTKIGCPDEFFLEIWDKDCEKCGIDQNMG